MLRNEKVDALLAKDRYGFYDLCDVLEILRGEGGCPWDAEQTHESIRKNFIEETYEVLEAIDNKDPTLLREELGDVMLQVVFHTQMEREEGRFDIDDVANDVCVKLIHRHPHIFGDVVAETTEQVLDNWEAIKNVEKSRDTLYDKLNSVPPMTPALMRATKVAKKSGKYGNVPIEKIVSGATETLSHGESLSEGEVGDLLFEVCALCSRLGIDPEEALFKRTNAFIEEYKE